MTTKSIYWQHPSDENVYCYKYHDFTIVLQHARKNEFIKRPKSRKGATLQPIICHNSFGMLK